MYNITLLKNTWLNPYKSKQKLTTPITNFRMRTGASKSEEKEKAMAFSIDLS